MKQSAIEHQILKGPFTLVDGGFDPIHPGHIAYFEAAKNLGLPVACLVAQDSYIVGKHRVLLDQLSRCEVLRSIRFLDLVIPASKPTWMHLEELKPAIFFKGGDWKDRLPTIEIETCERSQTTILFSDTPLQSSSHLLNKFLEG